MENASKALLMAAGVLIAMLIVSGGIYLKFNLQKTSDAYVSKLDTVELQKYNSNFQTFEGREDVTAQEIVTIIGIIRQKEQSTKIYVDGIDVTEYSEKHKNEFLENNILVYGEGGGIVNSFSCSNLEYNTDGLVSRIDFKKN